MGLKRVCLLVDTKWGMKPRDNELIHLMERYSRTSMWFNDLLLGRKLACLLLVAFKFSIYDICIIILQYYSFVALMACHLQYFQFKLSNCLFFFLKENVCVGGTVFLIDSRYSLNLYFVYFFLNFRSQTKYQIVLTKTDTVFPLDVARRAMQIEEVSTLSITFPV